MPLFTFNASPSGRPLHGDVLNYWDGGDASSRSYYADNYYLELAYNFTW